MLKQKIIFILFLSTVFGDFTAPINDEIFNFTHILFEWEQEKDAASYNLIIYKDNDEISSIIDSTLAAVIDIFYWNEEYSIKLRAIDEDGQYTGWLDSLQISILPLNNEYDTPDVFINNEGYQDGYTIIKERIIDRFGNIIYIWPHDPLLYCITSVLDNGQIIGFQSGQGTSQNNGLRSDIKGNILWDSPGRVIRELLPVTFDNELHYMGLVRETYRNTVPEWSGKISWDDAGVDSINWFSDIIIIWNEEGDEIWSWSAREHYSFEDVDTNFVEMLIGNIDPIENAEFDWTHVNSLYFDEIDSTIMICSRHLSRISKIHYQSGEIIWNLGKDLPSNDTVFGQNIDISAQHAIRKLDNGNLMVYDNGNFKDPELSRGLEIRVNDDDSLSAEIIWEYVLPDSLYTHKHGDCDRLKNGNSLITAGQKETLVEVDSLNNVVWAAKVDAQYRALRIPGLYPLIFSVELPNFTENISIPLITLPVGNTSFEFIIYNEGYLDFDFEYNIMDELGWFNESNVVNIASGQNLQINVSGEIDDISYYNTLTLHVCPVSIYEVECKEFIIQIATLLTNMTHPVLKIPDSYLLYQNYPNPFNPMTTLRYDLPEDGLVNITIFDSMGRCVTTLVNTEQNAGQKFINWNVTNSAGESISAGLYFYNIQAGDFTQTRKMVLLK
jgi:hypothetical protein